MAGMPMCMVCYNQFHPIDRPAKIIDCGHTVCSDCALNLFLNKMPCPSKCNTVPLVRPRFTRTIPLSIVPTTRQEDRIAVAQAIKAVNDELHRLELLAEENAARLKTLGHRVTNQLSTLTRFSAAYRLAQADQKDELMKFKDIEYALRVETEREKALLEELAASQFKLLAVSPTRHSLGADSRGALELLDGMSQNIRGVKRSHEESLEAERPSKRRRIA
ncbi:hypothetical protein MD484_g8542, partial [Candolleomyces efflorescens]